MKVNIILFILLAISVSYAVWPYEAAHTEVCFDIDGDTTLTGSDDDDWYSLALVELNKSGIDWDDDIALYHPGSSEELHLFKAGENSSHVFILIPIYDTITAGNDDRYCIYVGDDDNNDLQEIAPYGIGFDEESDMGSLEPVGSATTSWSDGVLTINASSYYFIRDSSPPSTWEDVEIMSSFAYVDGSADSDSLAGIWNGDYWDDTSTGYGLGKRHTNMSLGWYTEYHNITSLDTDWHILRLATDRGDDAEYWIYNTSFYEEFNGADGSVNSQNGWPDRAAPAYVRDAVAQYDWGVAYRSQTSGYAFYTTNVSYDIQDENITIVTPSVGSIYTLDDAVILRVSYAADYNNCSYYVNGVYHTNYTGLGPGDTTADVIGTDDLTIGANNISVQCDNNASMRYTFFTRAGSDAGELFDDAFGIDIGSLCSSDILSELGGCIESYNLTEYYDFAAVVCTGVNTTKDYSCLGVTNYTKNGYTIFYSPSNWTYDDDEDIQHIGAIFNYGGADIETRIEIYDDDKFMYSPAQDKLRDCDIYYTSTSYCSFWAGFVVNDRHVIISDRNGDWYIAGAAGYPDYDESYAANVTIPVTAIPIVSSEDVEYIPGGVYIRHNCYRTDDDYMINIRNTIVKSFTVTVTGNTSYEYSTNTSYLQDNISLAGIEAISVSDGNNTLCSINASQTTLFLPFSIPSISIDGYMILVWILMILMTILSAIVPFALFIPLMINDTYQLLNISQMAILILFAVMGGLINNSYSMERGIKHIVILVGVVVAYLSVLAEYDDQLGIDLSVYESLLEDFEGLVNANTLWDFVFSLFSFIIDLFTLLLTLPLLLVDLIGELLGVLSAPLHDVAMPFLNAMKVVFVLFLVIKGYEVISNKFKGV